MFRMLLLSLGLTAVLLGVRPAEAQTRLSKAGAVTLQVVATEPSQLADGVLQLRPGQQAELELRATDASGQALDLTSTEVAWQASHPDLLQVRADGARAVVIRRGEGAATVTVAAMRQTVTLRSAGSATVAPAAATNLAVSAPSTIATIEPVWRRTNAPLPTRDLCATGTPDPSWGQPCIRSTGPATVGPNMSVFIRGSGFTGTSTTIGGVSMQNTQSDTLIVFIVPPAGLRDGNIVVHNQTSGRSASASIRVAGPQILHFTPNEGRAGDRVTISGYGFSNPRPGVIFADGRNVAANEVVDGPGTLINATVPPGDVTGRIHVGSLVSAEDFVELVSFDPAPSDLHVTATGSVTVTGKALQNVTRVTLGTQPLPILSKSYTRLTFGFNPELQQLQSSVNFGQANFEYRVGGGGTRVALAGPNVTVKVEPRIVSFDSDSGSACGGGTARGVGLLGTASGGNVQPVVLIGNVQVPTVSASATHVSFAITKDATTGPVTIRAQGQQAVSSAPFRIVAPQPTAQLQSAPTPIRPGSTLQFIGRLEEVTKVSFAGGVEVTQGWTVMPIANSHSCQDLFRIEVPAGAASGAVTFTNPKGTTSVHVAIVP
jgi:hypothetical protein